jgi:hypothetical protein
LTQQVISVSRPSVSFSLLFGATWSNLDLLLRDDIINVASKVTQAQINAQRADPETTFGMSIQLLSSDADVIAEEWKCMGCRFVTVAYDPVDYTDQAPLSIMVKIKFEYAEVVCN